MGANPVRRWISSTEAEAKGGVHTLMYHSHLGPGPDASRQSR